MEHEPVLLNYSSPYTEPSAVRDPASVPRRIFGGVCDALVTLLTLLLTNFVAYTAKPYMPHYELLGTALGAAAVIALELQARNAGRTVADLRLVFLPGAPIWRRLARSALIHPFVCFLLAVEIGQALLHRGRVEMVLLAGLAFCFVDFIVLLTTGRRIGDHIGHAWIVRAYDSPEASRAPDRIHMPLD